MDRRPRSQRALPLVRWAVQGAYALFLVLVGVQFAVFYGQAMAGNSAMVSRPPAVEAFLPISALVGLRRFLATGSWDHVHPAGLAILCAAILGAFLARKSFCSWVCPVGTLERGLESVGRRFLWRRGWPVPPRWLALALTAPKHLIVAFFAVSIFVLMPTDQLGAFLESDYNLAADAKMLLFFRDLTPVAAAVLLALAALSLVYKHFWCRVLCPYGALLGVASSFSPLRVDRNEPTCTQCKACTRACPVDIPVHARRQVVSAECTGCLGCVAACPEPQTLRVALPVRRRPVASWLVPALGVGALLAVWAVARATGHWESQVPAEVLARLYRMAHLLSH
ncbi:MAG TPA: 4Fe-4S binding protein [Myxococcales bacterium]|jgi:polyferredoxin